MPRDQQSASEVLDYISSILRELRQMAQRHDQQMLAYLIDMAQLEASDQLVVSQSASKVGRKQRDSAA